MFQADDAKEVTSGQDVVESPEEQRALDRERARRANIRFSQAGLAPGSVLTSAFDAAITCVVSDDRLVEVNGAVTSRSGAAL